MRQAEAERSAAQKRKVKKKKPDEADGQTEPKAPKEDADTDMLKDEEEHIPVIQRKAAKTSAGSDAAASRSKAEGSKDVDDL